MTNANASKLNIDPYMDWIEKEGIPIIEDFGVDLFKVETKPWVRFDANGAAVHLKGRGDFVSMFLLDLPAGTATSPQRHLYEEVVFVLSGRGSTSIEVDGGKHVFEWGPKSMFAIPLNASYRHFNGSGSESVRMVSTTNMPAVMNMFHHERFIFKNDFHFEDRIGDSKFFKGEGEFTQFSADNPVWETNFVPDLGELELKPWVARGGGSSTMKFVLADSIMHAHTSEMPVGTYKKGHRHGADLHVLCVSGHGYSLLWYEGVPDFHRVDWKYGTVFAPPDQMFHQHFNTSPQPARYLATGYGSQRYPVTESKRKMMFGGVSTSVKKGGNQIEYEDQLPRIHAMYEEAARTNGFTVNMPAFTG